MSRLSTRVLLVALFAAMALGCAATMASANHLSIEERRFDAKWTALRFVAGGNTISCPVTIEGSFHYTTMNKVENALIGHISRASVNNASCTGGHATILAATLPWHLSYAGFSGRLPEIEAINLNLIGASIQIQPTGNLACLMRTTSSNWLRLITTTILWIFQRVTYEAGSEIPLTGSGGLCAFAGSGHVEGTTSSLTKLGSTAMIRGALI